MASENETQEDIIAELREDAERVLSDEHDGDCWSNLEAGLIYNELADRLEAARKRERESKPLTIPEWIDHEESIADIASVLRRYVLPSLADRLESAWKRELLSKNAEYDNSGNAIVSGGKQNNAAAMREALELLNQLFDNCVLGTHSEMTADEMDKVDELYFKTNAALAEPPRNCDVGTAEEQVTRFKIAMCARLPNCRPYDECCIMCALKWSQLPYEAEAKQC